MKKLVKLIMVLVLVMVSGCTTQKKEENARVIDTSIFLYKVSNQKENIHIYLELVIQADILLKVWIR